MPDVVSHVDTVETTAAPKQTRNYHPPSAIRDDLSCTNALVFEPRGKLLVICAHDGDPRLRYFAGSSSGLVTGAGLAGALLGGGGISGSAVGDTGSFSGITVYRLIGCPICAMATPPIAVFDCPLVLNIAGVATIPNVR